MRLDTIRQEIDQLDGEIVQLLAKRAQLVSEAGKLKKDEQTELKEFRECAPRRKSRNDVSIRKARTDDRNAITAIFNHHVEHGFAAYPEQPVDSTFYDFMKNQIHGDAFLVLEVSGSIAGFAFLKRYHAYPAFDRVAEVGYFLQPEYTRMGMGSLALHRLEQEAGAMGIDTLLANISSLNPPSLSFHAKHGFHECGRFGKISRKFGLDVDIVWMQKFI